MCTPTRNKKLRVFQRDHYVCRYCGLPTRPGAAEGHPEAPTIDHIIPRSRGGTDAYTNLVTAHYACNQRKAASSLPGDGIKAASPLPEGGIKGKRWPRPKPQPEGAAFRQTRWRFPPQETG